MHQELDADVLTRMRGKIHSLVNQDWQLPTLAENGLKDVAVAVWEVNILPVEVDGVTPAVPMPAA